MRKQARLLLRLLVLLLAVSAACGGGCSTACTAPACLQPRQQFLVQQLRLVILWAVPNTLQQHKLCGAHKTGQQAAAAVAGLVAASEVAAVVSINDTTVAAEVPPRLFAFHACTEAGSPLSLACELQVVTCMKGVTAAHQTSTHASRKTASTPHSRA
jgi:electron transfer flavoprotein alpha subunit